MFSRLILYTTLLSASASWATPVTATLAAQRSSCQNLRLSYYEDGALFYQGADGNWTGIDKDVIDEVARRTGCSFITNVDSRVRIWAGINNGTLDLSVSTIQLPEREKIGRFVPYLAGRNYVLLRHDLSSTMVNMDRFLNDSHYTIAVIKSYRHGPAYEVWLAKLRAQGRVYEAPDHVSMMRLLKVGRVQAVMARITSAFPRAAQESLAGPYSVMDWAPRDSINSGLMLSRKSIDGATAARFSQAIRAMRDDGTLRRIFERHTDAEHAAQMVGN